MRKYMFTFPHRIDYMASQLLVSPFVSAEDIIQNHTLLPFFLPFLSREKADLFYMGARGEGVGRTASRIRGERMGISSCRYCPECAAEDRKTYNEAYWHRLHQLPGITVCFKHGVHLEMSKWIIGNRGSSRKYETAEDSIPQDAEVRSVDLSNPYHKLLLWLAEQASWMLTHIGKAFNTEELLKYYRTTIALEGYERIDTRSIGTFALIAKKRIPPHWLRNLGWPSDSDKKLARWVRDIILRGTGPTVQHLLVLWLLKRTMQDLSENIGKDPVFESGPWPCLNRACRNYAKDVIESYRLGAAVDGTLYGAFQCECGYSYRRNGPDELGLCRQKPIRVNSTGQVWDDRLIELWEDAEIPTMKLASMLGVREQRIFSEARRLKLPENVTRRGYKFSVREHIHTHEEISEKHRADILGRIAVCNKSTRSDMFKLYPTAVMWLRRNDRCWLDLYLPVSYSTKGGYKRGPLDWTTRDTTLAAHVLIVKEEIIKLDGPLIRASKERLLKGVGLSGKGDYRSENLPLLTNAIEAVAESPLDFSLRKLAWRIKQHPNASRSGLMYFAHFRKQWLEDPRVLSAIELVLASGSVLRVRRPYSRRYAALHPSLDCSLSGRELTGQTMDPQSVRVAAQG